MPNHSRRTLGTRGRIAVGDAAKFVKERAEAERAMGKVLHAIEDRAGDSTQAADLVRDQKASPGSATNSAATTQRKASMAIAPCALPRRGPPLLQTRLDELGGPSASKAASEKGKKTKSKKGKQP